MHHIRKDSILNKCCSFELSIHQRTLKIVHNCVHNTDVFLALNHHIGMISEGSHDTD